MTRLLTRLITLGILLLGLLPAMVHAAEPVEVDTFTLENGMKVVVIPNHRVPAVSHMVWFRIGSADEPRGYSGLAHYLEHMMFKGTDKLKVGEYSQIVSKHGGDHNAFTSYDYTGYYVNIAKEYLPLAMELEANRMVNLKVDDEEFLKERAVIMEERSMRTDNQPAALLREQMMAALYINHPYHTPIIGWRHEMEALNRKQVFDMYHRFYHPNNAVLIVAGDITAKELKPLAQKYYGVLPRGEELSRDWTAEPKAVAERRVVLRDSKVLQQAFRRYYLAPSIVNGETEHAIPLGLLSQIAGGSQTSRLYQELVVKRKLATSAGAYYDGIDLGPSAFVVSATPAENVSLETLEAAVDEVLAEIMQKGVNADEMERAKTQSKADVIYARDGLQSLAYIIGQLYMAGLDEQFFNQWTDKIDAISPVQLQDAAKYIFKPERSVTGWLLPETSPAQTDAKDAHNVDNTTEESANAAQ
ncbi:MAG: insulinase family protein [Alphaproteobacteria bacterium]|nr:insulinase family protein [Alphaproteobacteria bacterium]